MFKHLLPENLRLSREASKYQTWILLVFVTDDVARCELSLPSEIEQGHITEWRERIIMPEISGDPGGIEDEHNDQQKIEVEVIRKSQG